MGALIGCLSTEAKDWSGDGEGMKYALAKEVLYLFWGKHIWASGAVSLISFMSTTYSLKRELQNGS